MLFLADESCDFAVVRALRADGHDVTALVELNPGASDARVIELGRSENRILLTGDKDFGQVVYVFGEGTEGVILLHFPSRARAGVSQTVAGLIRD